MEYLAMRQYLIVVGPYGYVILATYYSNSDCGYVIPVPYSCGYVILITVRLCGYVILITVRLCGYVIPVLYYGGTI